MLLERTISQLDVGHVPPERARELGRLGYLQWLGALPASANYQREARSACAKALPFAAASPAVAVFCALVDVSMASPPRPLPLPFPERQRRGGAQARRAAL